MNHWQLTTAYMGLTLAVFGGRLVKITGYSVPGSVCCEAVDGGEGLYAISTAFLNPSNIRTLSTEVR